MQGSLVKYQKCQVDDKQALVHTCTIGMVYQRCIYNNAYEDNHKMIPEARDDGGCKEII